MGRAKFCRCWEISAHPHGDLGEAKFVRHVFQEGEMGGGGVFGWGNAHQAGNWNLVLVPAGFEEGVGIFRQHAGFLRLGAGIDLNVATADNSNNDALDLPTKNSGNQEQNKQNNLSLEDYFQRFVLDNQSNMSETELAQRLGVSRKCLWERRQKLGIPRKKSNH